MPGPTPEQLFADYFPEHQEQISLIQRGNNDIPKDFEVIQELSLIHI